MGDIQKLERGQAVDKNRDDAVVKFLAEIGDAKKNGGRGGGDLDLLKGFPRFGRPDKPQVEEFQAESAELGWMHRRRTAAENDLAPEKKDELRKARREYSCAKSDSDRQKFAQQIESLVPGSTELNQKMRAHLNVLDNLNTDVKRPDPYECMRCHPKPGGDTYYDPEKSRRESLHNAYDQFFKPRKEDEFEAKWAQIALESPIVKANEVLRQLPPLKLTSEDPVKMVRMGLTAAGVELNQNTSEMIEKVVGGIKGIAKEGASRFVISRDGEVNLPFPEKRELGAGIKLEGLSISTISFGLGEGKYPELKDIKGLKVKLDVPGYLSKLGQIDSEAEVKRIFFTRNEGTGDFQVNVEVNNPVPLLVRLAANRIISNKIPDTATITVPIATLGPDGRPR